MDRKFTLSGLLYAVLGLALGIHMGASGDHTQMPTHAHIMLLGFVVTFIYGVCHKLWLGNTMPKISIIQFYVHHIGTLVLLTGLFLLYGGFIAAEKIEPILASASIVVWIGMILMMLLFIKSGKSEAVN